MADGKLYIYITDKRMDSPESPASSSDEKSKKENENGLVEYSKHRFFNFLESEAKTVVNYSISNIGNFTGNFQQQKEVENSIRVLSTIGNIGMAAIAGTKLTGSLAGGAFGAIISVSAIAVNTGLQIYSQQISNRNQNREIEILKKRSGLNTLSDGSRGTEN